MFVSWCASQASILYSIVPRYCYCPYGVNDYEAVGIFRARWSGYIPKRGDVIFFQKNGLSCHTGIVTGVNADLRTVINHLIGNVRFEKKLF